jgi:hypothetical protein
MAVNILLSTAYLPPVEYIAHIKNAGEVSIEREENYLKQSFRNRCYILSPGGSQLLTVPVYLGSFHKTPIRDIRIDYSKRWQQVHLGALTSAYGSAPYYLYYSELVEKILMRNNEFLLDLNMCLLEAILKIIKLDVKLSYTTEYMPVTDSASDFRYSISPKKESEYTAKRYLQVFGSGNNFVPDMSIIDLIFNMGPDSARYL